MTRIERFRAFPLLAGVGALLLALAAAAPPAAAEPRLGELAGEVEIGRGDPPRWFPARPGETLRAGDAVRTGRGARVEIELGTGTVRLFEASLLRLPPDAMRAEGPSAVSLDEGDSLFEVRPRKPGDPFEVRTPEVVASVKGTRFSVQLGGGGAAVSVFSGLVGVRGPKAGLDSEVLVRSGFSALGGAEKPFELSLQSSVDPWQRWQDGAPPPPPPASPSASRGADGVDQAKQSALRAVAPEVLQAAGVTGDAGVVPDAAPPASMPLDAAASAGLVGDDSAVGADPLQLGQKNGLGKELRERDAELTLNGVGKGLDRVTDVVQTPGGVVTTPGVGSVVDDTVALTLEVVKSGGPNRVLVSGPSGLIDEVSKNDAQTILRTGDTSLLSPALLQTLATNGVDPLVFTQKILGAL